MKPIFIPSKGRAGKTAFLKELNEQVATTNPLLDITLFVEPQDLKSYTAEYPYFRIVSIEQNEKGLSYARNYMLDYARTSRRLDYYWTLDDDLKFFTVDAEGKMTKSNVMCLASAEEEIIQGGYALGALEYRQFAWSNPHKKTLNSYCDCVVLNNLQALEGIRCDENLQLKIDRDLVIQCIRAGYQVVRVSHICFDTPKNGSNEGGLQSVYAQGLEEVNCDKMVAKWGESICTKFKKESGRIDIKINWNNINQYSLL